MTERMNTTVAATFLYMAMELGSTKWELAFCTEQSPKVRRRRVAAGDLAGLDLELKSARSRLGLPANSAVRSCHEAGRDGFWVHRELEKRGVDNLIVDAASMARARGRRAKSDRIDAARLLQNLLRHHRGENVWSVCRVPTLQQEDERRNERELARLKKERSSLVNSIKSGLALHGVVWGTRKLPENFGSVLCPNDEPLPRRILAELNRALERVRHIESDMEQVRSERARWLEEGGSRRPLEIATILMLLKGIGPNFSWTMSLEFLSWRQFERTKEVSAALGLAPTNYLSDKSVDKELGVSKTGQPRLRAMLVEIAWLWLRYQPDSALTRWFQERFGGSGKRSRRIGIVALARKLGVALWRFAEFGECPEGAVFKERGPAVDAFNRLMG